jgi:hypothetical protein
MASAQSQNWRSLNAYNPAKDNLITSLMVGYQILSPEQRDNIVLGQQIVNAMIAIELAGTDRLEEFVKQNFAGALKDGVPDKTVMSALGNAINAAAKDFATADEYNKAKAIHSIVLLSQNNARQPQSFGDVTLAEVQKVFKAPEFQRFATQYVADFKEGKKKGGAFVGDVSNGLGYLPNQAITNEAAAGIQAFERLTNPNAMAEFSGGYSVKSLPNRKLPFPADTSKVAPYNLALQSVAEVAAVVRHMAAEHKIPIGKAQKVLKAAENIAVASSAAIAADLQNAGYTEAAAILNNKAGALTRNHQISHTRLARYTEDFSKSVVDSLGGIARDSQEFADISAYFKPRFNFLQQTKIALPEKQNSPEPEHNGQEIKGKIWKTAASVALGGVCLLLGSRSEGMQKSALTAAGAILGLGVPSYLLTDGFSHNPLSQGQIR